MDNKMRARTYYAAAVSLFQDPSMDDCKRAIELLNEAVAFYPDFSEVALLREEVWHHLLKSLDPNNNCATYRKEYLDSPAWQMKRNEVIQRDGGQCVCGAQATEVHHKTYDNIGKEPLSDLVSLCKMCHEKTHQSRVPSDQQSATKPVKEALIAYVDRESDILQHADFGLRERPDYVGYESGYPKENDYHQIWLAAWLPGDRNEIAAVISIYWNSRYVESHYKKFEKHRGRIEDTFSFEEVEFEKVGRDIWHLRVVREGVDWTQTTDRDAAFRWLRENLEKLHWVLRVQETVRWDDTSSESQSSPNYLEPFNLTGPDIRKRRLELGLTQIEVAKELGMKDGTSIGDWENERAKIPPKHYAKLLEILKLTPLP